MTFEAEFMKKKKIALENKAIRKRHGCEGLERHMIRSSERGRDNPVFRTDKVEKSKPGVKSEEHEV